MTLSSVTPLHLACHPIQLIDAPGILFRGVSGLTSCERAGPTRHAALGLPAYVQFTSPIRRNVDLLTHWQLKVAASVAPWRLAYDPPTVIFMYFVKA